MTAGDGRSVSTRLVLTLCGLAVLGWGALRLSSRAETPHSPPQRHVVEITGMTFVPDTVHAAPGDTIIWINRDMVPHTATGIAPATWDTGPLMRGAEGRWVPTRGGAMPYYCQLHPTMTGMLIIR